MNAVIQELMRSGAASVGFSGLSKFGSVFSRENLINALLPRAMAGGLNHVLDGLAKPSPSQQPSVTPIANDEVETEEDSEDLLAIMEEGFEETNDNLVRILHALGEDEDVSVIEGIENHTEQLALFQNLDDGSDTELLEINGKILKTLDKIEENTDVDELALRERELESTTSSSVSNLLETHEKEKSERSGIVSAALEGMGDLLGGVLGAKAAGKSARKTSTKVKAAKAMGIPATSVVNNSSKITSTISKTTSMVSDKIKSAVKGVKGIGGKLLGAPLALGMGGYEAYQSLTDEKLTVEEKTTELSKIGGKTAGALAGAKAGAALGAIGGPFGAAVGGLLGGIGGFFLGEQGGEVIGNLINSFTGSEEESVKNITNETGDVKLETIRSMKSEDMKTDMLSAMTVSSMINPSLNLEPGQTRANNLQMLTQQIETVSSEKETMRSSPIVAPVTINNAPITNHTNNPGNVKMPIPIVRNQDGTIQRLLDSNYRPLLN